MRESIMATILQDYPTLFEFEENNTLFTSR
jgi:hypothetical protein